VDTVGGGDAFAAALVLGLLLNLALDEFHAAAARIAALVCASASAPPPLPDHLQRPINRSI